METDQTAPPKVYAQPQQKIWRTGRSIMVSSSEHSEESRIYVKDKFWVHALDMRNHVVGGNDQPFPGESSFLSALMAQGGVSTLTAQIYLETNSIVASADQQKLLEQRNAHETEWREREGKETQMRQKEPEKMKQQEGKTQENEHKNPTEKKRDTKQEGHQGKQHKEREGEQGMIGIMSSGSQEERQDAQEGTEKEESKEEQEVGENEVRNEEENYDDEKEEQQEEQEQKPVEQVQVEQVQKDQVLKENVQGEEKEPKRQSQEKKEQVHKEEVPEEEVQEEQEQKKQEQEEEETGKGEDVGEGMTEEEGTKEETGERKVEGSGKFLAEENIIPEEMVDEEEDAGRKSEREDEGAEDELSEEDDVEKKENEEVVDEEVEEREDDKSEEVVGEEDDMQKEVEERGGDEAKEVEREDVKKKEEVEEKEGLVLHEKEGEEGKRQREERHWKLQNERGSWREGEQNGQVEGEQRTKFKRRTKHHMTERKGDSASRTHPACDTPAVQQLQNCAGENPARKTRHCHRPSLQWKLRGKCPTPSVASSSLATFMARIMAVVFLTILLFGAALASANQVSVSLHVEGLGHTLQGKDYRLVCVVTPPLAAHTGSDFSWYRNAKLLVSQKGRVLTFAPLSKGDEGNYQCGFQQEDNAPWVKLSDPSFLHVIVLEKISLVPEVEVEEGQTVILNCSVDSDPIANLTWRLGGKTLYTVRSDSDSLVLHNASQYHLQIVECEAYNNGLVLDSLNAYSLIRLKGTYEVVPTPHLIWSGATVLHHRFALKCIVGELPNQGVNVHLTYTWYKDDKVMEGQSDMILDFPSLRKEDSGLYTCTARDGKPRTTSLESNAWEMVVFIPPVVHIEPSPPDNFITQIAEETLTLTCKVTEAFPGVAPDGYRWSYLSSPGGQLRPLEGRESTLTLGPLTREDSGQYICQAWNYEDFDGLLPPGNASVTVDVVYLQNITLTPSLTANEGDRMTLTCSVDSNPAACLSWLVEGREVRHVTANMDHYVLERAACSDNKTYTCRASIPHLPGQEIMRSSHVLVRCKEKVPPVVHIEPRTPDNVITQAAEETLTLTCKVTEAFPGVAPDGYRWSYLPSPGGQLRPLEGRESTLTLGPLTREDSGQYICQAWNSEDFDGLLPPGNASVTVDVVSMDVPRPPYSVSTPAKKDMEAVGSSPSHTVDLGVIVLNIILVVTMTGNLL